VGERATVGVAQLGGDADIADARAWRSRWGWAATPALVARRVKVANRTVIAYP
jgi:hypothetical protein